MSLPTHRRVTGSTVKPPTQRAVGWQTYDPIVLMQCSCVEQTGTFGRRRRVLCSAHSSVSDIKAYISLHAYTHFLLHLLTLSLLGKRTKLQLQAFIPIKTSQYYFVLTCNYMIYKSNIEYCCDFEFYYIPVQGLLTVRRSWFNNKY